MSEVKPHGRIVYYHYPDKSKGAEKQLNNLAPLFERRERDDKLGCRVVSLVGSYLIIRPGWGPPLRGMKVICSYDGQGASMLYDWFDAIEMAQRRTTREYYDVVKAERKASRVRERAKSQRLSRKARVKQSRRQRNTKKK